MMEVENRHREFGVRVVGLYGMGGIGKTTISKALCSLLLGEFTGKVFHAELGADKNLTEVRKNVLRELTEANEEILLNADKVWR
jgi:ABC-type Na+ transport system ATPase subunit NatA